MTDSPATQTFHVSGMSCQHCVRAITEAIRTRDGAASVQVDLPAGTVRVVSALPRPALRELIAGEGYEVAADA